MKTTVTIPNGSTGNGLFLATVPASPVVIPGWPEIPAVVHRPFAFDANPPGEIRNGWKVSCAVCGVAMMDGRLGDTRKQALEIAAENFATVLARFGDRARIISEYIRERDRALADRSNRKLISV